MNMNASHHYFVGLDVHLHFTAICILDVNGEDAVTPDWVIKRNYLLTLASW